MDAVCTTADVRAVFQLHLVPTAPPDKPTERREAIPEQRKKIHVSPAGGSNATKNTHTAQHACVSCSLRPGPHPGPRLREDGLLVEGLQPPSPLEPGSL